MGPTVYLSERLVDDLFHMIRPSLLSQLVKKVAGEIGVNTGVFSAKLSVESDGKPSADTVQARLSVVIKYLEGTETIGTIEEPALYFRGALPMSYGPFQVDAEGRLFRAQQHLQFAYFAGTFADITVGLVGSQNYLAGMNAPPQELSPSAFPDYILRAVDEMRSEKKTDLGAIPSSANSFLDSAKFLSEYIIRETPPKRVEFLAVKHYYYPSQRVLLGSPIYVRVSELS